MTHACCIFSLRSSLGGKAAVVFGWLAESLPALTKTRGVAIVRLEVTREECVLIAGSLGAASSRRVARRTRVVVHPSFAEVKLGLWNFRIISREAHFRPSRRD